MEVNREPNRNKSNFGLICMKYLLFLLNIVFLIVSVLVISSGISAAAALTSYYYLMSDGLDTLTVFWLVVGIILLLVALFGIFAAFKESTALANIYGILMIVVFVLQIVVSIYGFTRISHTEYAVSTQLDRMMRDYSYGYQVEVDWIQSKFGCCGINSPSDWQNFGRFSTASPYYDHWNNYHPLNETQLNQTDLMPVSCCKQYSNYVNLKCEDYHTTGCFAPIHQIVSASVMMIGTSSMIASVLQLLGIILGFSYARTVRNKKTQRDMQIWNTQGSSISGSRQPTDYSPVQW